MFESSLVESYHNTQNNKILKKRLIIEFDMPNGEVVPMKEYEKLRVIVSLKKE